MSRREVHWTLEGHGFKHDKSEIVVTRYTGSLKPHGKPIPVIVEISDWGFVTPPAIRLGEGFDDLPLGTPHIENSGGICYSGGTRRIFDRYDPGGTILTCLAAAEVALEDIITGRAQGDIPGEFANYWGLEDGSGPIYYDFPEAFHGMCRVLDVSASDGTVFSVATVRDETLQLYEDLARERDKKYVITKRWAMVIKTDATAVTGDDWPPKTLTAVLNWLAGLDENVADHARNQIGETGLSKIPGKRKQRLSSLDGSIFFHKRRRNLFAFY